MTHPEGPSDRPIPIHDLRDRAEQNTRLYLPNLQPNDHLRILFDNDSDLDRVTSLEGEFVVEGFNSSFTPNPAPPTARLTFASGNAFPAEYQGKTIEVVGTQLGYSSIMPSCLTYGRAIEVDIGNETVLSQPVSGFSILRPQEDGSFLEISPNALGRTIESDEHTQAQALLEDVRSSFLALGIGKDQSASRRRLARSSSPDLDGEVTIGTDYAMAQLGEYYIHDGETGIMYVVRQESADHIQIGEYRGLSTTKLQRLSYLATSNLYATGVENITYNTSNTSSVFMGGVAYTPSGEDAAAKLHLEKANPDSRETLYPPTFNIDARGGVQIELNAYLYRQEEEAYRLVEDNTRIERNNTQITIQVGDKTISIPALFQAGNLESTLGRMRDAL